MKKTLSFHPFLTCSEGKIINTDHRIPDSAQSFVFIGEISAITFSDRFPLISIASETETMDQPNMKNYKELEGLIKIAGLQSKGPADRNISYLAVRPLTTRNQGNVFNTFISSKSEYVHYKLLLKASHEDSIESCNPRFLQCKKTRQHLSTKQKLSKGQERIQVNAESI